MDRSNFLETEPLQPSTAFSDDRAISSLDNAGDHVEKELEKSALVSLKDILQLKDLVLAFKSKYEASQSFGIEQRKKTAEEFQRLEQELASRSASDQELEQLNEEFAKVSRHLEESLSACSAAQKDLRDWEQLLEQKKVENEELAQKLAHLEGEHEKVGQSIKELEEKVEDKDQQLYLAQQHLAKKVRETAQLTEKIEIREEQAAELLNLQSELQSKNSVLQNFLDQHVQEEARLQDQLQQKLLSAEADRQNWEKKFGDLHQRHQEAERRIQELEAVEEKNWQLQTLLSNVGHVLNAPASFTKPKEGPRHEKPPAEVENLRSAEPIEKMSEPQGVEKAKNHLRPYQNLFDIPNNSSPFKQNLFDREF